MQSTSLVHPKLERLRANEAEISVTREAMLADAVNCTMDPSNPAGTFPGLPPFQLLTSEDALKLLADFPSSIVTGWYGFAFGVAWVLAMKLTHRIRHPAMGGLLKALIGGVLLVAAHAVFRRRAMKVVTQCCVTEDVSSAPTGPCRVVCNVLTLSNSHAGTHADTPFHFARDASALPFSPMQYNGSACVMDVASLLEERQSRAITIDVLDAVERSSGIPLATQWRILFRTTKEVAVPPAYFDVDAARYLASLPNLIMIATDSISVDNPTLAPICDGAHGAFFGERVAIVENVILTQVPIRQGLGGVRGVVRTVFHPTQAHEDSWGCSVWFSPSP
jgi:kynurenine formamidase